MKNIRLLEKKVPRIFKIPLHLRDPYISIWKSLNILNISFSLTLKQVFWKTKNLSYKLEYRYLIESTAMENTIFRNKTVLSKADIRTNRIGSTKLTYCKEESFDTNDFVF